MSYILCLLPIGTVIPAYILTAADADRWVALTTWLAAQGIATATAGEFSSPDSLTAGLNYCILGDGLTGAFPLFSVVATPDWGGAPPAPQYATITANLSWVLDV